MLMWSIYAPLRRRRWHELDIMGFAIAVLFIGFMPHKDVFNYIAEGGRRFIAKFKIMLNVYCKCANKTQSIYFIRVYARFGIEEILTINMKLARCKKTVWMERDRDY